MRLAALVMIFAALGCSFSRTVHYQPAPVTRRAPSPPRRPVVRPRPAPTVQPAPPAPVVEPAPAPIAEPAPVVEPTPVPPPKVKPTPVPPPKVKPKPAPRGRARGHSPDHAPRGRARGRSGSTTRGRARGSSETVSRVEPVPPPKVQPTVEPAPQAELVERAIRASGAKGTVEGAAAAPQLRQDFALVRPDSSQVERSVAFVHCVVDTTPGKRKNRKLVTYRVGLLGGEPCIVLRGNPSSAVYQVVWEGWPDGMGRAERRKLYRMQR